MEPLPHNTGGRFQTSLYAVLAVVSTFRTRGLMHRHYAPALHLTRIALAALCHEHYLCLPACGRSIWVWAAEHDIDATP